MGRVRIPPSAPSSESSERRIEGRYIEVAIMLRNTGDVNEKSKPYRLTDPRGDACARRHNTHFVKRGAHEYYDAALHLQRRQRISPR